MITNKDIIDAIEADDRLNSKGGFGTDERQDIVWFYDETGGCPAPLWTDGTVIKSATQLWGDEDSSFVFESRPEEVEIYQTIKEMIDRLVNIYVDGDE